MLLNRYFTGEDLIFLWITRIFYRRLYRHFNPPGLLNFDHFAHQGRICARSASRCCRQCCAGLVCCLGMGLRYGWLDPGGDRQRMRLRTTAFETSGCGEERRVQRGQVGALALGKHPAHDVATEDVPAHVQMEAGLLGPALQFGDVPGPDLVRRARQLFGFD